MHVRDNLLDMDRFSPHRFGIGLTGQTAPPWLTAAVLALYGIGAAWAVADPHRALPDRIAGTYLVPR